MSEAKPVLFLPILKRIPGESSKSHYHRVMAFIRGDDVRSRTDLRDWTGSPPFHLDRYPPKWLLQLRRIRAAETKRRK